LTPRGVIVEAVLLRDVQLPALLKASIEAKQQAEQDALRMNFILQKKGQEAERKSIEAKGISDFQKIVAQGSARNCSSGKGIEATENSRRVQYKDCSHWQHEEWIAAGAGAEVVEKRRS